MSSLSFYQLILLMVLQCHSAPVAYDPRANWSSCISFHPEDQGSCNGCAAASLSSALGIRACIRDGRNIRFSAQQIWDCYGGSCENGVNIENFMFALLYGQRSDTMLRVLPRDISHLNYSILPSNISECKSTSSTENIVSISYHKEWWRDLLNNRGEFRNATNSIQNMQREILENGPITSILYLTSTEMNLFSRWRDLSETKVLKGLPPTIEARNHMHAVTVIGWGNSTTDGTLYWKILNSFGENWGNKGIGNIQGGFGLAEHEWYSVSSTPIPCSAQDDHDCILTTKNHPLPKHTHMSVMDDEMIVSPANIKQKIEGNVKNDGLILGMTIGTMCFISILICSIHFKREDFTW